MEYWRYTLPLHNENNLKQWKYTLIRNTCNKLYEEGKTKDKKYRFQPQMVKRYQLRIKTLEYVQNIEELYAIRSFHYEVLKGDKAGISSIRVNDQYRIEITVKQSTSETVVTICNILELSNHYK